MVGLLSTTSAAIMASEVPCRILAMGGLHSGYRNEGPSWVCVRYRTTALSAPQCREVESWMAAANVYVKYSK